MKATGIVRRIDDLGRIVIPKEIRRTMRIREGDPLEIYTDREGSVIFRKYSPIGTITAFATEYAAALNKSCNLKIAVTDRDAVIACAGIAKKGVLDTKLSTAMDEILTSRALYESKDEGVPLLEGDVTYRVSCAMPIVTGGDITGAVVSLSQEENAIDHTTEIKLITTAAVFLGKQFD